jgi:hypothetical protein
MASSAAARYLNLEVIVLIPFLELIQLQAVEKARDGFFNAAFQG